jgi:hypothetical protein
MKTKGNRKTIRMSEKDSQILEDLCKRSSLNSSELFRESLTKLTITPRISEEEKVWLRELTGMANNLNQIAKTLNYTKQYEKIQLDLMGLRISIEGIIKKLRA